MSESEIRDELCGYLAECFRVMHEANIAMDAHWSDETVMGWDAMENRLAEIKAMPRPGVVAAQMSEVDTIATAAAATMAGATVFYSHRPCEIAEAAYDLAEAMLKERKNRRAVALATSDASKTLAEQLEEARRRPGDPR